MKGFIRLRGDAFELRVFLGADTLTDRRVAQAPLVRVRSLATQVEAWSPPRRQRLGLGSDPAGTVAPHRGGQERASGVRPRVG